MSQSLAVSCAVKPAPKRLSSKRWLDAAALGLLAVVAAIAVATFRDYGLGWDDYTHSQYGDLLLALYASGFKDQRALSFVNLYMYGGGFDMAAALIAKVLPFDLFETRRLVGALVGLIGLAVTWRFARRIGGPLAGLIAVALLAACPLYYGHMFMNPKDIPFAVAMMVLLFGLARLMEDYPAPTPASALIFAVGLGATVGTRILAGVVAIPAAAALLLLIIDDWRNRGARTAAGRLAYFGFALIPALIVAYAVMAAIWPWSVLEPLNPLRAVEYFSHFFEKPWKEMYDGTLVPVPEMPRSYVPTLLALKLPEVLLVLGSLGVVGSIGAAFRPRIDAHRRAVLLLIALAVAFPVALAVASRPAMYNGVRHFVFVLPPLAALGGVAGAWLLTRLAGIARPLAAGFLVLLLAGFASVAAEMVRLHPYQYIHFNRIAGGVRSADERYMLDYWGLAFKQAADEFRALLASRGEIPNTPRRWRIAVCGPHPAAAVELGPEFLPTWDTRGADFALTLGEFYCADLKAPVVVEVKREGVTFARVYDLRGRNVGSLFTIPPVR